MSGLKIPFTDLPRQYATIRQEILDAQDKVYSSGRVVDGENTVKFEAEIAKRCNRKYAVAVNSCTQALVFANLMTERENPCVVMPAYSFIATLNSVLMANRYPKFIDVDNQGLIDLNDFGQPDANTLLFVDLYGGIPNLKKLSKLDDWLIIEDAAQAFGSYYDGQPAGTFGHISCLSFAPTKNLPNYGTGGMLLTDDEHFYQVSKDFRDNGKFTRTFGSNCQMTESDCASMLVKLKYFDGWQQRRKDIADYYSSNLKNVEVPKINPSVSLNWHKYVIQSDDQSLLQLHLANKGIETKIHYPYTFGFHSFRGAYSLTYRVLSLPIYPELSDAEVEAIVGAVNDF